MPCGIGRRASGSNRWCRDREHLIGDIGTLAGNIKIDWIGIPRLPVVDSDHLCV